MKIGVMFSESTTQFKVKFNEHSRQFEAGLGEVHIVTEYVGGELYDGEYEVTPTVSAQTIHTNGKVMTNDVTIKAIPIYETSNTSGGSTVYIAKEV